MRKLQKEECGRLAAFMIEQFFEKEEMQLLMRGIDPTRAKQAAIASAAHDLRYLCGSGDIFAQGDPIDGAIAGIAAKKLRSPKRLLTMLQLLRHSPFQALSREEIERLRVNAQIVQQIHSKNWFRQYVKDPYYIAQLGVAKEKRGQGIAGALLAHVFASVRGRHQAIVLETLTPENVPLYEHFGFALLEQQAAPQNELTEYRLIKRLD